MYSFIRLEYTLTDCLIVQDHFIGLCLRWCYTGFISQKYLYYNYFDISKAGLGVFVQARLDFYGRSKMLNCFVILTGWSRLAMPQGLYLT